MSEVLSGDDLKEARMKLMQTDAFKTYRSCD